MFGDGVREYPMTGKKEAGNDGRQSRRPTIRDVAARAGVSSTTVSHALNNKGRIDPATRERVIAAAAALGYRANRTARALRTRRNGSIAFVVPPWEQRPAMPEMLSTHIYMSQASSAASAAFAREYALMLVPPSASADHFGGLELDGCIICDPSRNDHQVKVAEALNIPIVTIERDPGRPGDPWHVRADNEADGRRLLDHLAEQGAEKIAMISLDAEIAWTEELTSAYRGWCKDRGREPQVLAAAPHHLENNAYEKACEMLDDPDPPDAIFATAERFANGVIRAARERDIRIPEDLMVAGAIDGWEAREAVPPVTAIDVRPFAQGAAAAELLISRIEGEGAEGPMVVASNLNERASTDRNGDRPQDR